MTLPWFAYGAHSPPFFSAQEGRNAVRGEAPAMQISYAKVVLCMCTARKVIGIEPALYDMSTMQLRVWDV